MKIQIKWFLPVALTVFISQSIIAQTPGKKKELLIQTDELKAFRVFLISQELSAIDGVHFWGYISKTKTLMITYDEDKINDWSIIIIALEHLNKGICLEVLENETIFASIERAENLDSGVENE